jgi:hypothetical protein
MPPQICSGLVPQLPLRSMAVAPRFGWSDLFSRVTPLVLGAAGQGGGGGVFFWLAMFAVAVSPIACGIIVGTRRGIGVGGLTFLGVLMLYVAIAFAGCMLVLQRSDRDLPVSDARQVWKATGRIFRIAGRSRLLRGSGLSFLRARSV